MCVRACVGVVGTVGAEAGAPAETPEKLVRDYLAGTLQTGANACDH